MSLQQHPINIDINTARAAIDNIRSLDLAKTSIDSLKEILTPVFRGYVVNAPRFDPGLRLFRSRVCNKPKNISDLLHPPPDSVKLGRVNRPGCPILYCCTSREAPFFESRPKMGDTVAIVHWVTTALLTANHVGYDYGIFQRLGSNRPQAGWALAPIVIPGDNANREIAQFLADVFTRVISPGEEHYYKLSVAVGEKLFSDELFDSLIYPTIAMRANADNFVLKPRYADKGLRFVKAEFVRINQVCDFAFDIDVLDIATELAADGNIQWKGHREQWVIREPFGQLSFRVENGQWVACNKHGQVINPE